MGSKSLLPVGKSLLIGEAGECDLSDGGGCSVAECARNRAIGADIEILERAAGGSILLNGRRAAGGGFLRE